MIYSAANNPDAYKFLMAWIYCHYICASLIKLKDKEVQQDTISRNNRFS